MKLKFKIQPFQTAAVNAVADCFAGQMPNTGLAYSIDPGQLAYAGGYQRTDLSEAKTGFRNAPLLLSGEQILANVQNIQRGSGLPVSSALVASAGCPINLDIEMETGTGKTYCYIKTIFELNKRYGWTKFIIVVPASPSVKGCPNPLPSRRITFWRPTARRHASSPIIPVNCTNWKTSRPMPGSM